MKRRYYILGISLIFILVVLVWFTSPKDPQKPDIASASESPASAVQRDNLSPQEPSIPQAAPAVNPAIAEQSRDTVIQRYFSQPINFHGKVVDEKGVPVDAAEIQYSVYSDWLRPNQKSVAGPKSDSSGKFAITGKSGASIFVRVTHPDFYETEQSKGNFSFGDSGGFSSSSSEPVVFVLHKKGMAEPLVSLRQVKPVQKDGTEARINVGENVGGLTVQMWASPPKPGAVNGVPFAWKCRVSVTGGGLVPYKDEYQFTAPEKGYAPFAEFEMPEEGKDGKWRDRFEQLYFLKLANGHYARAHFRIIATGGHFAVVQSYYNPSGSRNLEYDPSKTISRN